ncbi:hypothetical protein BLOT_007615 [Blomia tropicalis]|nr:hypothetical protein BLOT_007615 [Blomia tropicalis]
MLTYAKKEIVTSAIVLADRYPELLVEEEFGPKLVTLYKMVAEIIPFLTTIKKADSFGAVPFSSELTSSVNRNKNRIKVKLPNNFLANLSH